MRYVASMADKTALLHHDRDRLSERRAAYRPRLRGDRDRRDRALHAARRLRRVLPHRHRRARPEDSADRDAGRPDAARSCVDRNVPRFQAMVERMNCSNDDFIRTTEERHHRSSAAIWERMEGNGDIYLSKYAGWYSVRDEAYYAEDETDGRRRQRAARDQDRHAGRMGGGGELFLPPLRLSGQAARTLQALPTTCCREERLNEVESFVRGGLQDLSISRTTFDWGVPVPGNPTSTSCMCGSTR